MTSKKYSILHPPLVARIYEEEKTEKAAKTRLHQMFGAYVQGNTHKKAEALINSDAIDQVLRLHASTKERLPHYPRFCEFILSHIEWPQTIMSIMDLGCGFNPFAISHWGLSLDTYFAYDIDTRTRDLLNQFFLSKNLPQAAACMDLVVETPTEEADLALMCKLVPVVEAQLKGRGFQLANALNAKYLAITYPLQSLGGKNKGMGKNYDQQFKTALAGGELSNFTLVAQEEIGNELVYVMKKENG